MQKKTWQMKTSLSHCRRDASLLQSSVKNPSKITPSKSSLVMAGVVPRGLRNIAHQSEKGEFDVSRLKGQPIFLLLRYMSYLYSGGIGAEWWFDLVWILQFADGLGELGTWSFRQGDARIGSATAVLHTFPFLLHIFSV